MEFRRCSTQSECNNKDKESSDWEKGDCSVLGPVASGTVDTGEGVGVDWWSIAIHTTTTHLTLSFVRSTHYFIGVYCGVHCDVKKVSTCFSVASVHTRTNQKLLLVCHTVALMQ